MTVRLKHSLLAGVVALLVGIVGGGCSEDESVTLLMPEGQPAVLQAFIFDTAAATFVPTFGIHRDLNRCGFDKDLCEEGFTCNTMAGDPQTTLADHCVDAMGKQPRSESARVQRARIRLVVKELLDGAKIEQFLCACNTPAGCGTGKRFSDSPTTCTGCAEDPATAPVEADRCLDLNGDDFADQATFKPDVATITCGSLLTYSAGIGDGFYYPSGSQVPTSTAGVLGLGPALVFEINGTDLPTNSECTIAVNQRITDKDNQSFTSQEIGFHTENLALVSSVPTNNAMMVAVTTAAISVTLNARIKASSLAGNVTVTAGGTAVTTGTPVVMNLRTISIPLPAGTLQAATTYTVNISANVTDEFGQKLPAAITRTFTTK